MIRVGMRSGGGSPRRLSQLGNPLPRSYLFGASIQSRLLGSKCMEVPPQYIVVYCVIITQTLKSEVGRILFSDADIYS